MVNGSAFISGEYKAQNAVVPSNAPAKFTFPQYATWRFIDLSIPQIVPIEPFSLLGSFLGKLSVSGLNANTGRGGTIY